MASSRITYHHRLFLWLLSFLGLFMGCFVIFQYDREKKYKAEQLNERLQLYNVGIADAVMNGVSPQEYLAGCKEPFEELRVSIINNDGRVVFDNTLDTLPTENHLSRPEIRDALRSGIGFARRRHSFTTNDTYFYSAMSNDSIIVRTAAPYTMSVREMLKADSAFLWFMFGMAGVMSVIGYYATRKIGHTITRLNQFAAKAERGEQIYGDDPFPHDELGDISGHIVQLYANLQQAMMERDRQHEESLRLEHEKNLIKRQLSNNINHELKTPVASMQVCLETIIEHPDLPQSKKDVFVGRCYDNCRRLQQLLADVSTITRLEDGQSMIEKEPIDLSTLIKAVVEEYSASGIPIRLDIPSEMKTVGNYSLLSAVFRNLISNANAYSRASLISITAHDSVSGEWIIDFRDNGIGVDESHHSRLFERFYRVDSGRSRNSGGTGLGLSIVKNTILFHGGTITVSNHPEGGLRFLITLPGT